jgi:nicotianamine synthase
MSTEASHPSITLANPGSKTKDSYTDLPIDTPPTTPTALSTSAHALLSQIHTIYQDLCTIDTLAPGEKVNGLLTRLVHICIAPYDAGVIDYLFSIRGVQQLCIRLRSVCAVAEGELEGYWVDRMLATSKPSGMLNARPSLAKTPFLIETNILITLTGAPPMEDVLSQFPYHQNYIDLSRLEASLLSAFLSPQSTITKPSPLNIAFIGSGPLPLTSIHMLSHFPTANIHNIDRDAHALQQSVSLCQRLGSCYTSRMTFVCEDATTAASEGTQTQWAEFDVVFLAALVGMTNAEKTNILGRLVGTLRSGCLVLCRSAKGMRGLLYPVRENQLVKLRYQCLRDNRFLNSRTSW